MSYKILVRVYQTNPSVYFHCVEKTVWNYANGGTWSEYDGQHVLTMGGSGTSGTLRFQSDGAGEEVVVALGVHNYKRWADIVTGLSNGDTAMIINAQYYNGGFRSYAREKQLSDYSVRSAAGRTFEVKYTVSEGNELRCNIIIH